MFLSAIATNDNRDQPANALDRSARASSIDMWIGSRVRIKRTSRGMSQREFSKLMGIDQNDLAAFEAGAERVNANLLFRMAKLLDVRPDYFFQDYTAEEISACLESNVIHSGFLGGV